MIVGAEPVSPGSQVLQCSSLYHRLRPSFPAIQSAPIPLSYVQNVIVICFLNLFKENLIISTCLVFYVGGNNCKFLTS